MHGIMHAMLLANCSLPTVSWGLATEDLLHAKVAKIIATCGLPTADSHQETADWRLFTVDRQPVCLNNQIFTSLNLSA